LTESYTENYLLTLCANKKGGLKMKVWEFEEKVWEVEGIRIVIRTASDEDVSNYTFKNGAQEGWRITLKIVCGVKLKFSALFNEFMALL
jgi:hypothetical protein